MNNVRATSRTGVFHLLALLLVLAIGLIVAGLLMGVFVGDYRLVVQRAPHADNAATKVLQREPSSPPTPVARGEERSPEAAAKPQAGVGPNGLPAAKTRPAWVDAPPHVVDGAYQTSVAVGPYTTRGECDAKLPDEFQKALDHYADVCLDETIAGQVRLPNDYLRQRVVKDEWEETRQYSVGRMLHLHVLLQFDRQVKERILEAYRETRIAGRLWWVGGTSLAVWGLLAVLYGYLKWSGPAVS